QAGEVADVDSWYAWVVISDVTVEAGNAEIHAGRGDAVHGEVIQRVEVDAVVPDPEVVVQVRPQRVCVGKQRVLVHAGLRDHLDRNGRRRVSDVGGVTVVPVIAEVQPYLVADVLVDACEDLVDVVGRGSVGLHVGRYPRLVRRRVGLEKLQRDRGQLRPGNDVAWKRLARDGVPDGGADFGKVPLAHQRRRNRDEAGGQPVRANPFVRAHEEGLVVAVVELGDHHGTVHLRPELVAAPRILRVGRVLEIAAGVEGIVLEVLGDRSVRVVGAALGHDVDVDAEVGAVLRRGAAGLDLNLRHRVRDRTHAGRRQQIGGGVDAVQRQAVLDFALARSSETEADIARRGRHDAWRGARQAPDIAPVQRQIAHRALADRFRDPGAVRVEHRRGGDDGNRFVQLADLHDDAGAHHLVVGDFDAADLGRLGGAQSDSDLVGAGADELDVVVPVGVRGRFVG